MYPRQGQDEQQQGRDRDECYHWAMGQSGYDPNKSTAGLSSAQTTNYYRAMGARLDGRVTSFGRRCFERNLHEDDAGRFRCARSRQSKGKRNEAIANVQSVTPTREIVNVPYQSCSTEYQQSVVAVPPPPPQDHSVGGAIVGGVAGGSSEPVRAR
jgi:hypothetical protein